MRSQVVIKNNIRLLSFDAMGYEATQWVEEQHMQKQLKTEVSLSIALLTFYNTDTGTILDQLAPLYQDACLSQTPLLLACYLMPEWDLQPQGKVEFLRRFSDVADSIIVIPAMVGLSPAQALARLPQFLINAVNLPGMITLEYADFIDAIRPDIAVFVSASHEATKVLGDDLVQQWQSIGLPPADVQEIIAYIGGDEDMGLDEYTAIEQLLESNNFYRNTNAARVRLGMTVLDVCDDIIHVSALFFGLSFY